MNKLLLLLVSVAVTFTAHAQVQKKYVVPKSKFYLLPYRSFTDTSAFNKNYHFFQQQDSMPGSMPVIGLYSVQLTYQYNNGNGLDVYSANIDNMPVVKPDATFYSAMPNKGGYIIQSKPAEVTPPKSK